MGVRGGKPKPTALRVVQGNPGRRPLPKGEPKVEVAVPDAPKHLSKEARAEWRRVTPLLAEVGMMTRLDGSALAAYCEAYARWVEAERMVAKEGVILTSPNGYPMPSPYLTIVMKSMREMQRWLVEFGMTPSSRTRIKTGEPAVVDEFDELLKRG